MGFSPLDNAFWIAGFIGHVALFIVLSRSARWHSWPVFMSLIAYEANVSVILFFTSRFGTSHAYFVWYWVLALGDYLFQVALLIEIAGAVFPRSARWVFHWKGSLLVVSILSASLAAGLCMTLSPPDMKGLDLWDERVTLFTSLLTCEIFLIISIRANSWRLRWDDHVMAIGQGLALWAAAAVVGDVVHAFLGWKVQLLFLDHLRMFIYLGDLGYWMWAFRRPERAVPAPGEGATAAVSQYWQSIASKHRAEKQDRVS